MKKRLLAVLMALAMISTCFAGCGSKETEPPTTTEGAVDEEAVATSTCGNELVIGINGDIDDFNPQTNQTLNFISLFAFNCYETLIHLDENMEYVTDLATEYEVVDDTTYTFKLREGVKFHNGEIFTADDVVYTFEWIQNEANAAWRITQYTMVEDVTADNDYQVTFKLSSPNPAFLDSIAYTPIMSKSTDSDSLNVTPIGTGAYKFVSWTPNDNITLEKYEEYWDADTIVAEKLVIKPFPDYSVAITNMEAGTLDVLTMLTVENKEILESKDGLKVLQSKSSNKVEEFEIGRHNVEAFKNPDVLKAMKMAFNAELINEQVYGGIAKSATSCLPSGAKYYKAVDEVEYNLEAAKELLATTPYKDGFEFDMVLLSGYAEGEKAAMIWQADLAQIGITMNIKKAEFSVWLDTYLNRTYDMIDNNYAMVGSDPSTYCSIILSQLVDYQTSDLPRLNELIEQGVTETDETKRAGIYEEIQTIVATECPVYTYMEVPQIVGLMDRVEGLTINNMGHVFLKGVTLK
ncbi:ABC transporter substrate-binding protein [Candidatus Merdisoma sp. JLR.KK006]|jgi:peptide/nickel transport system substrate-binding protein|uniref:ABC transporter substrate-binding protein n=1 Tax=Candidatus Merdisoma sp. JLR.KK006 TaxID=3112626 RepID=UPI002FEFD64C